VFKEPYNKRVINLVLLGLYRKVFAFGLSGGKYFPVQTSLSVNPRADGAKRRARVLIPPGYLHPGKRKH
jgi:hypothetical protein